MTITDVKEIEGGGKSEQVDPKTQALVTTYNRRFYVIVDNPLVSKAAVLSHISIPAARDIYATSTEYDPLCRVVSRRARQTSGYRWEVDVEYSSKWYDPDRANPNPLLRPTIWQYSFRDFTKPCEKDFTGWDGHNPDTATQTNRKAVLTSSLERFDPPLVTQHASIVMVATKNFPSLDPTWEEYLDPKAVNDDVFDSRDAGTVLFWSLRASDVQEENLVEYIQVTFEFHYRKQGWLEIPLDRGFRHRPDPADLITYSDIVDATGRPSRPRLLNGFGIITTTPTFLDGEAVGGSNKPGPFQLQPRRNFAAAFPL